MFFYKDNIMLSFTSCYITFCYCQNYNCYILVNIHDISWCYLLYFNFIHIPYYMYILALVPSGVVRYCLHSYHVGYTLKHRPMLFLYTFSCVKVYYY